MKNLIKNTGIYFLVNLISQFAVFVLWIIIARALSTAEVGIYVLAIFIVDFFGAFAIFGLNSAITRFYYSEEKNEEVFFNSLLIFILANFASLIVLFISVGFLSNLLPSISFTLNNNIYLFGLLVITSAFYNFSLSHYSALKKPLQYSRISLMQTGLFFVFSLLFLYLRLSIVGIFYALLISYFIPTIVFLISELRFASFQLFSIKTIKSLLHYGVPIMLYSTFGTLVLYIGRIFLDQYANLSILGIYGFFLVITMQVNAVWATFNRAWTPEIFSQLTENKDKALDNIKKATFLSSFLYLLFMVFLIIADKIGILGLFLKEEYVSNIYIFYILLLGPLFNGIYTSCYPLYYYEKKTKIVMVLSLFLNLINILLTFFMVKEFSQNGAALSYFILSIITTLSFIIAFRRSMNVPLDIIKWTLILSCLMIINVLLFLRTSSDMLFLSIIFLGLFLAYRFGELDKFRSSIKFFAK